MRYNRGIRGYGFPPRFGFYGGARTVPLLLRRVTYSPGLKTTFVGDQEYIEQLPKPRLCDPELSPVNVQYSRSLPHQEPPPSGTIIDFPNENIEIPAGADDGDGNLAPGVYTNTNLYTVPRGFRAEIKKLLIMPYDTDYNTLYVTILRNGLPYLRIEGARRYDGTALAAPSYDYGLSPTFPQDQFNIECRFNEGYTMGIQIANHTPGIRFVSYGLFGWKYITRCVDRYLGVE